MKVSLTHYLIVGWTCTLLTLMSCGHENKWEQESATLIKSSKDLSDRHLQLDASVDSLWDVTTTTLEKQLPEDFPSIDRSIFLKARNADHMMMFKSFDLLDADTKSLIIQAGEYDKKISQQMMNLMEEGSKLERDKNQFLSEVAQQDLKLSRQYADQFRSASNVSIN